MRLFGIPFPQLFPQSATPLAASGGSALPEAPTDLAAAYTSATTVHVTWTPGAGATSQRIYRSDDGAAYALIDTIADGVTATYDDTTADYSVIHSYKVAGVNAGGETLSDPLTIVSLLRDAFATPVSAPLAVSRNCEPGAGIMAKRADSGNRASLTDGKLSFASGGAFTDPGYRWQADESAAGWARKPGRTLRYLFPQYQTNPVVAWFNATTMTNGQAIHGVYNTALYQQGTSISAIFPGTLNNPMTLYWTLRPSGCFAFTKVGTTFPAPALSFVDDRSNASPLWPGVSGATDGATAEMASDVAILDLTSFTDAELALFTDNAPVSGNQYTAQPDAILIATFALPASPSTGDFIELRHRIQDSSNYRSERIQWNSGTSQWDLTRTKTVAGVTSTITTDVANIPNTTVTLQVITNQTNNTCARKTSANVWTKQVAVASATGIWSNAVALYFQGVTVSSFIGFGTFDERYNALDQQPTTGHSFLALGDSKTLSSSYQQYLIRLQTGAGGYWIERPFRIAQTGWTVTALKNAIDAQLALCTSTPEWALLDIGVNDTSAGTSQSTFETNLAYILDALHTKWPSLKVGVVKVGLRGYAVQCSAIAGYIDNVLASRSAWARVAFDEQSPSSIQGGDDYATYTSDGTHPNDAGQQLEAAAWKAFMDAWT